MFKFMNDLLSAAEAFAKKSAHNKIIKKL